MNVLAQASSGSVTQVTPNTSLLAFLRLIDSAGRITEAGIAALHSADKSGHTVQ
jgi:hypothetical protein